MSTVDRRTILSAFGIAAVTYLLPARAPRTGQVALTKPGENRFSYGSGPAALQPPCLLTSADSAGSCSIFELRIRPKNGSPLHVHHREDEWFYVLSGEFIFRPGKDEYRLPAGASIWLPREVPHVWANVAPEDSKMILTCTPGGFEKFFDESSRVPSDNMAKITEVSAKYGMEMLDPPIFSPDVHKE